MAVIEAWDVTWICCNRIEEGIHAAMTALCDLEQKLWDQDQDMAREQELNPYEEADCELVPIHVLEEYLR